MSRRREKRREGEEDEEEEKRRRKKEGEKKIEGMELYGFLWFGMTISLFRI